MRTVDQAGQLARGDGDIRIRDTLACGILVVALDLKFLCNAGHDADHDDVLRVKAVLLCKPSLNHRAGHLLRGLTGGHIRQQVREIMLAELDPAG